MDQTNESESKRESPGIDIRIPWAVIKKIMPWVIGGSLFAGGNAALNRWLNAPYELAQIKQEVHDIHQDVQQIKEVLFKKGKAHPR